MAYLIKSLRGISGSNGSGLNLKAGVLPVACILYSGFCGSAFADASASAEVQSANAALNGASNHHCVASPHSQQHCELTPIVVTASNPDQQQAFRVNADPKQPIQPVPATDGADYLKQIAGFSAIRNGGTNGDPVFRGMFGSRLKILTNGSELLGACPNRMDAPTSYISPQNFDEISVVKGPQTVLYGAASAATVNFSRQPPQLDGKRSRGQGSVMAGSNHRFDSDLESIIGNEKGSVRLNANTSQSDDYRDGAGNKVPAEWRKWNTDLSATYTPTDESWLELSAGKGDGEARYAGRSMDGSQFLRESVGLRFEQKNLSTLVQKLEGQLNYNKADHIMDNFSLRQPAPMDMGGGHGHGGMTSTQPMANTSTGTMGGGATGNMTGSTMDTDATMTGHDAGMGSGMSAMNSAMAMQLVRKTLSGRLAASMNWLDYTLIGGIDGSHSEHEGRMGGQYSYESMPWNKDAQFEQVGIFAELSKPLTQGQKLVSGLRIDQHQVDYLARDVVGEAYPTPYGATRRETLPSGFIRLESQWPEQFLTSYVGVGHVQRMPDYWELFTPVHSGSSSAFLGVEPEQTTQLDAGLNYRQGPWSGWLSAYAGKINDFILISYHQHAGHSGNSAGAKNIEASIAGTEAGLAYQFTPNLRSDLNLAYSWGRNDSDNQSDDKPLPQIAPLDVRLGMTYQQDRFSVGGLLRMVDKQSRIALNQGNIVGYDLGTSSRFAVVSLNAAYQLNPALNLSAGVDNLFDKAYSEHLNRAGNAAFGYAATQKINETGRNIWLRLGFSY